MSLVNDMLRDLEQRNKKSHDLPGSGAPLRAAQAVEPVRPKQTPMARYLLWLIGLLAIVATLWLLWSDQQNASNPPGVAAEPAPMPVKPEPTPAVELPKKAAIASIQWSGTEQGGDLVVRLEGDADIQLLEQDAMTVTVAFDGVTLAGDLPAVNSPLVERIDLFRESERIELTFTTRVSSRFAFRVQHNPTTMILGVLPEAPAKSVTTAAAITEQPEAVSETPVVNTPVVNNPIVKTQVAKAQPAPVAASARPVAPVKKVQRALTDQQAVAQAGKLVAQGQLEEALALLQKRISAAPSQSAAARGYQVTLLLSMGELDKAQAALQAGLAMHQNDLLLRKLQARLWLSEAKVEETAQLLKVAVPQVADDPEYHELLATLYQQQGLYEQAAQVYFSLLEYQNNTARWWVGMAYSLELAKRYPDARQAYQSALQLPGIAANLKTYAQQRVAALSGR